MSAKGLPTTAPATEAHSDAHATARAAFEEATMNDDPILARPGEVASEALASMLSERRRLADGVRRASSEVGELANADDDPSVARFFGVVERQAAAFERYVEASERNAGRSFAFSVASLAVAALSLAVAALSLASQFGVFG